MTTTTDPKIPFIPSLTPVAPYGDTGSCYDVCDLLQRRQDNCTSDSSRASDCSTSSHRVTSANVTTRSRETDVLLQEMQADEEEDTSPEAATTDEEGDEELENSSSSLTTETVQTSFTRDKS